MKTRKISQARMKQLRSTIILSAAGAFEGAIPGSITYIGPGRRFYATLDRMPTNAPTNWIHVSRRGKTRRYEAKR